MSKQPEPPSAIPPAAPRGGLAGRLLPPDLGPRSPEGQARLGMLEGGIGAAVSLLLAGVKFALGAFTGSVSMTADAFNNLTDVATSALIGLSFHWARKPRDREHPFGHGRIETVAGLALSLALILVGIEVGRAGLSRLLAPTPMVVTGGVLVVVLAALALKAGLAALAWVLARATGSLALRADAWNHLFDILSSTLVLVALLGARLGWNRLDGVCGIGVAGFILVTGIRFAGETVDTLLGKPPDPDLLRRIEDEAHRVPGVQGVHDIIVHEYGSTRIVTLHIETDALQPALACHALTERVEQVISEALGAKVMIHADPVDRRHPFYTAAEEAVRATMAEDVRLIDYHDLRVEGEGPDLALSLDWVVRQGVPVSSFEGTLRDLAEKLFARRPEVRHLEMGIETAYASDPEFRRAYRGLDGRVA